MKKVSFVIGGKRYTITLEDPHADAMEAELTRLFETGRDNDTRILLEAFLERQLELFEIGEKTEKLLKKIENTL